MLRVDICRCIRLNCLQSDVNDFFSFLNQNAKHCRQLQYNFKFIRVKFISPGFYVIDIRFQFGTAVPTCSLCGPLVYNTHSVCVKELCHEESFSVTLPVLLTNCTLYNGPYASSQETYKNIEIEYSRLWAKVCLTLILNLIFNSCPDQLIRCTNNQYTYLKISSI